MDLNCLILHIQYVSDSCGPLKAVTSALAGCHVFLKMMPVSKAPATVWAHTILNLLVNSLYVHVQFAPGTKLFLAHLTKRVAV